MFQLYYDQDYVYFTEQEAREMAHEQLFDWLAKDDYHQLTDLFCDSLFDVANYIKNPITDSHRTHNNAAHNAHWGALHEALECNDAEAVGRFCLEVFHRSVVASVIEEAVEEWEDRNNV